MILVWGVPGDPPLDSVYAMLLRRGARTLLLDQRADEEATITMEVGACLTGTLSAGGRNVALESISGFYLRPQDRTTFRNSDDQHASTQKEPQRSLGAMLDDTLMIVADLSLGVVLNRPDAMAANNSKPYQYAQIRSAGFVVPDTVITTSPDIAREFIRQHERVIYKSVSGVRSIVGELREADTARLTDIRWCPTQLQERIDGVDVRVHVVGDELFACEVRSSAVDYRYAHLSGHRAVVSAIELPDDCAERCLALARGSRLPLAGIDLRRTDDGRWYCFEINPSPGFTFYQNATGAPIDAAIARLLATG